MTVRLLAFDTESAVNEFQRPENTMRVVCLLIALALAACSTAPISPEEAAARKASLACDGFKGCPADPNIRPGQ